VPLVFVGMAVGTAGWFFFYSIFALKTRRNDVFNAITSVFYFVFLFASSMFYPLEPLPKWLRTIALLNPITWQIDWFRFSSIGMGNARQILWEGAAFVAFSVAGFAVATRLLQQQE
jgi:ABC-2 type transport system permease protein